MAGKLYIIAAPSGAGKTSLVKALIARHSSIRVSVSHTTRPPRPGEEDGKHYHFISHEKFEGLISQGDFLEYAQVFGNYYGTSKSWVNETLAEGIDVILEIDWQGANQVRGQYGQAISIFILPPSLDALEERLVRRAQDSNDIIRRRLREAQQEMSHHQEFDFIVINDIFEEASKDLSSIITSERLRQQTQCKRHSQLISELLADPTTQNG
jgi:guanylate kinase